MISRFPESLEELFASVSYILLDSPSFFLDLCWVIEVLERREKFRDNAIYSLLTTFVISYFGGVVRGILLNQQQWLFTADVAVGWTFVLWFLMLYTPFSKVIAFRPVRYLVATGSGVSWGRFLIDTVAIGMKEYHSVTGALLFPCVIGCVGSVLEHWETRLLGESPWDPRHILRVTLFGSMIYYFSHPHNLVFGYSLYPEEIAKPAVVIWILVWTWSLMVFGTLVNPFSPLESAWSALVAPAQISTQTSTPVSVQKTTSQTKETKKSK